MTMPELPHDSIQELVNVCDLTIKDAKTLVELDGGSRLDYYDEILEHLGCSLPIMAATVTSGIGLHAQSLRQRLVAKTAANWYAVPTTNLQNRDHD